MCLPFVLSAQIGLNEASLEVQTREPDKFYDELPRLTLDEGIAITGLESPDNNLESVFQYLVER